jgi:hypothetical protein
MGEPSSKPAADSSGPSENRSAASQPPQNPSGGNPVDNPPHPAAPLPGAVSAASPVLSVKYLGDKLEEAELLLGYAAEVGIDIDDKVRDGVLKARVARDGGGLTQPAAADLITALTKLAAKTTPVTVASLKACVRPADAHKAIRSHLWKACWIGGPIILISLCTFVSERVSEKIKTDIDTANALVAKLSAELGPPPSTNQPPAETRAAPIKPDDPAVVGQIRFGPGGPPHGLSEKEVISDLQQFAATMRGIDGYARQLNRFVPKLVPVGYGDARTNRLDIRQDLELPPGLNVRLSWEFARKVEVYQGIRNSANNVREVVAVYYGAIATCILPVLYALLGAEAYLLRLYEDQIQNRTFLAHDHHGARYLIAGIGGLVVGLFNVTQTVSFSPFAVAFLAGYAVDVFFAFLEGLLQMFRRGQGTTGPQGSPPKTSN